MIFLNKVVASRGLLINLATRVFNEAVILDLSIRQYYLISAFKYVLKS